MRYEVVITPTYQLDKDIEMSFNLDKNKFLITNNNENATINDSGKCTLTIPKGTVGAFKTNIFVEDNPNDEFTPELEEVIVSNESAITNTLSSSEKYNYSAKLNIKRYTIEYVLDGVLYDTVKLPHKATVTPKSSPEEKEGHTFTGWKNEPTTMPNKNVTVNGSYSKNKYVLTYLIDGVLYYSANTEYNATITPKTVGSKAGYVFSGWDNVPTKMPASNVTVNGSYTAIDYTLTIKVNDTVIKEYVQGYDTVIDYSDLTEPSVDGYTFTGWSEALPSKMPINGKTINAVLRHDLYKVTYKDGDTVLFEEELYYNDTLTEYNVPVKEGYTSNGWDITVPTTMPLGNVTINAVYVINKHNITYKVDGETHQIIENVEYGTSLTAIAEPSKVGYTFSGWSELPATMPDADVNITGTYTINKHNITYKVDGEIHQIIENVEYGTSLTAIVEPSKIGYTFSGWSELPATMPDEDVVVTGTYVINKHNITYKVDGETHQIIENVEYGTSLTAIAEPSKVGYTFSGWSELPATMPDEDVTITGTYVINKHTVTYKVDGSIYETFENVEFGASIPTVTDPSTEGYTFSGWSEIPTTMPDEDVTITGNLVINTWTLKYIIDSVIVKEEIVAYGTPIESYDTSVEGYTFSGWDVTEPTTMPNNDVTLTGSYTVKQYVINYYIDNVLYTSVTYDYESEVTPVSYTPERGYSFTGWDNEPSTMPSNNVNLYATTSQLSYTITFKNGETIVETKTYKYGEAVVAPTMPDVDGYVYSWNNLPTTMPDENITVTGEYVELVENIYYGSLFSFATLNDMDMDDINTVELDKTNGNSVDIVEKTVDITEDEYQLLDDWDTYDKEHKPVHVIALPTTITSFVVTEVSTSVVQTSAFKNKGTKTINGVECNVYVRDREDEGEQFYATFKNSPDEITTYKITY